MAARVRKSRALPSDAPTGADRAFEPDAMTQSFAPDERADRRDRFLAAGRHSARVRWLKRLIVAFCALAVVVFALVAVFDPFRRLPQSFSVQQTSLNGSRIVMERPRLSGFRDDGRPYDLRAASGVQDIRAPSLVELSEIEAKFDPSDQNTVHLVAPKGVYDSSRDTMTLDGDIEIDSTTGYDIRLHDARVNFKQGSVESDKPLTVTMATGVIAANGLRIADNGRLVRFIDGVETTLKPVAPASEGTPE